jgi:ribonuclease Z
MKKLVAVLVVLGIAAGGYFAFADRLVIAAMERQVLANLSGAAFAEMSKGLHVVLCGAGSPLPDPTRSGPCVLVVAGDRAFIVDVGSGAARNLGPMGLPVGRVEAVFLTHFHSDHIDGLGELLMQRWAGGGRGEPLPVHGPGGVEAVVAGFNQAYSRDQQYRVAHHGAKIVAPSGAGGIAVPFEVPAEGQSHVVLEDGGLKVTAFLVSHPPIFPAVGYRFDFQGRSAVISGDTVKSANLQKMAEGADVLLHEALHPGLLAILTDGATRAGADKLAQITRDILDYHTTPIEAAQVARDAHVRHLVYYHVVPALPLRALERKFVEGVDEIYDGGVTVGRDGTWIALPPDSKAITIGARL